MWDVFINMIHNGGADLCGLLPGSVDKICVTLWQILHSYFIVTVKRLASVSRGREMGGGGTGPPMTQPMSYALPD